MTQKNERIGMKLNRFTVIAFGEYKNEFYGSQEVPISDGYLVSSAYNYIKDDIPKIDWEKVNAAKIPNVTDRTDEVTNLRTTITIDPVAYEGLRELQAKLVKEVKGRVFFSYVIKLVMYAALLKKNNLLEKYLK